MKTVVIAGYGVEGKASYEYWRGLGYAVAIADEKDSVSDAPGDAHLILGATAFSELGGFDVIVRSPSIAPSKLPYGDKVWSATREFFAACPAPIIGVTGTKGKGTTSSLITSILRAAGKTVHLVGNIGTPALEVLPTIHPSDIVVFELSSFQLWDLQKSPHIAVVLGIEPDHLDIHSGMDDYVNAKANITKYQRTDDIIVYNQNNQLATQIAALSPAQKIAYPFVIDDMAASLQIPGQHNVENASAAIAACREYVTSQEIIKQGLHNFAGLPHRLKFVAEKNGVKYYDDSISTTPGSAIAAMQSFDTPKVLLLGGSDKGAEYNEVMAVAEQTGTKVLAIGQTGQRIYELAQASGVTAEREEGGMPEVVAHAARMAPPDSVVMLSPASASFDQYKSYSDRGDQFIAAVEGL